jgi:hypothetical protein
MDGTKHAQIEKLRRLIDKIALYSLFLDMAIAGITMMSFFSIKLDVAMPIIELLLTLTVVLSIGLFAFLFWLKHEEKILDNVLGRKYRYRTKILATLIDKIRFKLRTMKQED